MEPAGLGSGLRPDPRVPRPREFVGGGLRVAESLPYAVEALSLSRDCGRLRGPDAARLWDNEILMGWYAANEGSIRPKGTMYFVLDAHGLHMSGRWVGPGYDDKIMTGWGSMAKTHPEAEKVIAWLNQEHGGVEIR